MQTQDMTLPIPGLRVAYVVFDQDENYSDAAPPFMDAPLADANVCTSLVDGSEDLHKPVLDLDHGVTLLQAHGENVVLLNNPPGVMFTHGNLNRVVAAFREAGVTVTASYRSALGMVLCFAHPVVVVPSSRPGHGHLYVDQAITWSRYLELLLTLRDERVLEEGWVLASEREGATCVRLPWVSKYDTALIDERSGLPIAEDPFL